MTARTSARVAAVCAGVAGLGMVAVVPAAADATAPASVGAPVVSNLNTTGLLGMSPEGQGEGKAAGLPVGGGLLGGLPAGLPVGG